MKSKSVTSMEVISPTHLKFMAKLVQRVSEIQEMKELWTEDCRISFNVPRETAEHFVNELRRETKRYLNEIE